jgi:hypothetical protein
MKWQDSANSSKVEPSGGLAELTSSSVVLPRPDSDISLTTLAFDGDWRTTSSELNGTNLTSPVNGAPANKRFQGSEVQHGGILENSRTFYLKLICSPESASLTSCMHDGPRMTGIQAAASTTYASAHI